MTSRRPHSSGRQLLLFALLALIPTGTAAGPGSLSGVRIGTHLVSPSKNLQIDPPPPAEFGCDLFYGSDILQFGDANTPYHLYFVVMDINPNVGLAGLVFGIDYGSAMQDGVGIDIFDQRLFADVAFPDANWPESGTGITLIWSSSTNCQNTPDPTDPQGQATTVAYGLYVYAYDPASLEIVPRPGDPGFKAGDCTAGESYTYPCQGRADFGTGRYGYDPCWNDCGVPVEEVTWGRVKRTFGR